VSDHLHQAVQAEIAAHTPILPPSFGALKARKKARDRRRTLSAVAASALAVGGIAFVPSAFVGGEGPAPAQVAGDAPSAELLAFHIKAADAKTVLAGGPASHEAVSRCAQLPGLSDTGVMYSYPAQYAGEVAAGDDAKTLTDCVEAVPGWGVTFTRVPDAAAFRTYTVRPSVRLVANTRLPEQRDACFALPGVDAVGQGESQPVIYKVKVALGQSLAFEQCISRVVGLYVPELDGSPQTPDPGAGEAATWSIDPKAPPQPDATRFTALVSRVACNSGETGEVLTPRIEERHDRVVVTFTVAPQLAGGSYDCQSNTPVRVEVQLAEPVGNRPIEDGACRTTLPNGQPVCRDGMRYPAAA
jgi:hypothetical protein